MKKVLKAPCLFCGIAVLLACFFFPFMSMAEGKNISVKLKGQIEGIKIYSEDGKNEIVVNGKDFSAPPGIYKYICGNKAEGYFEITKNTKEITLALVDFTNVKPNNMVGGNDPGNIVVFENKGETADRQFMPMGSDEKNKWKFVLPQKEGDGYYTFRFTPYDIKKYLPVEGHIYVYRDTDFDVLNLSDKGSIPWIEKDYITIKAPVGMEVLTTWQLKLYMARNFQTYEAVKEEGGYCYYKVPVGYTFMLRQTGKVTRYCEFENLPGEWNSDHTEITLNPLEDNPNQVIDESNLGYYASMMTNLPENSTICLNPGEYFDIVPLRAWQAVDNSGTNQYNDPEWHYEVIGDSGVITVGPTEDDKIGQYGRVQAQKEGTVLVAFWYDAMETRSEQHNDKNNLHLFGALQPELTGVAVVHVTDSGTETKINNNIDIIEGRTIYYLKSLTDAQGNITEKNNSAKYTFTPTAETNGKKENDISVYIYETQYMAKDGKLNNNSWNPDGGTSVYANPDGSYTLDLKEGRNIIRIKAGDAVTYHVILARGIDVTVDNLNNKENALATGDVAQITIENLLPPIFKQGAIYNPSSITYSCKIGTKYSSRDFQTAFGQYMAGSKFNITLLEEDEGIFTISGGAFSASSWGALLDSHRKLTRNSMTGYWNGGDNPDIDYGKMAYLPDISFAVGSNDELKEVQSRSAGLLKMLWIGSSNNEGPSVAFRGGPTEAKDTAPINQTDRYGLSNISGSARIVVGAALLNDEKRDTRLLVRYWSGDNVSSAVIKELALSEITKTEKGSNQITGEFLDDTLTQTWFKEVGQTLNIEMIVLPTDGTPMTYAKYLYDNATYSKEPYCTHHLTDLQLKPVTGGESWDRWDGILKAENIIYNGEEIDLGYGFIGTESEFTTSVPYETDKISFTANGYFATSSAAQVIIKVETDETDTSYCIKADKVNGNSEIPLKEGINKVTVTYQPKTKNDEIRGQKRIYIINVERRTPNKEITFEATGDADAADLTDFDVFLTNSKGKAIASVENDPAKFSLENGEYTYYVSSPGYGTAEGKLTVDDGENAARTVSVALEKLEGQGKTATVRIAGQDTVFCQNTEVKIPENVAEAADLTTQRYVQYNYGGYTALHALIDALTDKKIGFRCYKGRLTPDASVGAGTLGDAAGWVCEVNGVVCNPATTRVRGKTDEYAGDTIEFYYNADRDGMTHAWLEPGSCEVKKGEYLPQTLYGRNVCNTNGNEKYPIAGAEIYDGEILIGMTDGNGKLTLNAKGEKVEGIRADVLGSLGEHYLTAVKKNDAGEDILTATLSTVNLVRDSGGAVTPDEIKVSFRLIGDRKHNPNADTEEEHAYTTWIKTREITITPTIKEGESSATATVGDVFKAVFESDDVKRVFGDEIPFEGLEKNYISSIDAPTVLGGYNLAEKDNGKDSGWMYTVNGKHPDVGLNECVVQDGDEIIFHYVDNPSLEVPNYKNGSPQGSPSDWNSWLWAEDVTPGAKENAQAVDALIEAIGPVDKEHRETNETSIKAARDGYNALTDEEKGFVTKNDALEKAEEDYAALLKQIEDEKAAEAVVQKILDANAAVEALKPNAAGLEYGQTEEELAETEEGDVFNDEGGAETQTEPESVIETQAEPESVTEPETETVKETKSAAEPGTEKQTEAESTTQTETGSGTETKPVEETPSQGMKETGTEAETKGEKETLGIAPLNVQAVRAARTVDTGNTEKKSGSSDETGTSIADTGSSEKESGTSSIEGGGSVNNISGGLNMAGSSIMNSVGNGLDAVMSELNGTGTGEGGEAGGDEPSTGIQVSIPEGYENALNLTREARLEYEKLTQDQKEIVRNTLVKLDGSDVPTEENNDGTADMILVETEAALALLMGPKTALAEAESLIDALKPKNELTMEDVALVRQAEAVYDAAMKVLKENPDEAEPDETLKEKLNGAAEQAELLEAGNQDQIMANKVIDGVNGIKALVAGGEDSTESREKIYANRKKIASVKTEYEETLNDIQRGLVKDAIENVETILSGWTGIVDEMNQEVDTAAETLKNLFEKVNDESLTLDDEDDVKAAGDAYDALTSGQKQVLLQMDAFKDIDDAGMTNKLGIAQNMIDGLKLKKKAADEIAGRIEKLSGYKQMSKQLKDLIEKAAEDYKALGDDVKSMVPNREETEAKLKALEEWAKSGLDTSDDLEKAKKVATMINALPDKEDLTLADKAKVEEAKAAYGELTEPQKAMISAASAKLEELVERLEELEGKEPTNPDDLTNPTNPDDPTKPTNPDDTTNPTNPDDPTRPTNPDDPTRPSDQNKETTLTYSNYPVTIKGKGLEGCELTLKALSASDSDVKKMQGEISSKEALIRLYDISLYKNGREIPPPDTITINFQVGTKYNDDTLTVLHVVDGKVKSHKGKVSGGVLPVEVDSLSPFGVVVNTSTVMLSNTNNGANNGTTSSKDTLTCGTYPVSVTGKGFGDAGYTLKAEQLTMENEAVKLMQAEIGSDKALIRLFDITLYKGDEKVTLNQSVSVNFQVGTKYNGEALTVLHVVEGKVEKLSGIVSSGVVSVTVDSLSPFGVVVDSSTLTNDGTLSKSENGASATGGTSATGSGARTGDDENPFLYVIAMLVTAGIFAGLVFYEKKKAGMSGKQ